MFLKNAWYVAAWSEEIVNKLQQVKGTEDANDLFLVRDNDVMNVMIPHNAGRQRWITVNRHGENVL